MGADPVTAHGFHTTQYDLNMMKKKEKTEKQEKFPYYIVRFKQNIIYKHRKNEKQFPYYIVRFKQI